jgi:DNA helicase-2/ATP-dependent DNA helicase PcrA
LSDELGNALHLPGGSNAITLNAPLTAISERYGRREGITLSGQTRQEDTDQPLWQRERLQHAIFGAGTVVGEDERAFEVRFDNGDTLNFSKQSAHLYFNISN